MKKIVLICEDKENHRYLVNCLETLFPSCCIEIMEKKRQEVYSIEKFTNENLKGGC